MYVIMYACSMYVCKKKSINHFTFNQSNQLIDWTGSEGKTRENMRKSVQLMYKLRYSAGADEMDESCC